MLIAPALILAVVLPGQTSFEFKLKFPLGLAERYTMTTTVDQTIRSAGEEPVHMAIRQTQTMTSKVTSSDSRGSSMRMTYGAFATSAKVNGKPFQMPDSDMSWMKGRSIMVRFAPSGKVTRVTGLKELMAELTKRSDPSTKQLAKQMQELFSEENVKHLWELSTTAFAPSKPARIGDSWPSKVDLGTQGMAMKFSIRTKFAAVQTLGGHKCARLDFAGTGAINASVGEGVTFKTESMNVSGRSYFDFLRGWFSDTTLEIRTRGHADIGQKGHQTRAGFEQKMNMAMRCDPIR